ncbi:MAG: DUF4345 domain-containing protein [Bacteroidota bacterium]
MNRRAVQLLLAVAGLVLIALGVAILVVPHAFFATNGIVLGSDPSLLSEIRAPGALLAGCGLLVLRGVVQRRQTRSSLYVAVFVYGAFGAARLLSIALDGIPATSLLWATGIELGVAILCASAAEHDTVLNDAEQARSAYCGDTERSAPSVA